MEQQKIVFAVGVKGQLYTILGYRGRDVAKQIRKMDTDSLDELLFGANASLDVPSAPGTIWVWEGEIQDDKGFKGRFRMAAPQDLKQFSNEG